MSSKPVKPIEDYPIADPADMPPLPPQGVDGEPGNSVPAKRMSREIAVLQFVDPDAVRKRVPLQFHFWWEGMLIDAITVRRLAVAEVGLITEEMIESGDFDLYRYYEAMTGLPAPVLRGMIEEDGEAMLDAVTPFLPRIVQETLVRQPENEPASPLKSVSGAGGDMPLPQPDP